MKLFRYLMLAVTMVFATTSLSAQTSDDMVKWKTTVKHVKDDVYRVTFQATIASGYHIYDLGPSKKAPMTEFTFEKSEGLALVGKLTSQTKVDRKYDDTWKEEIGYYYNSAVITQDVKLTGNKAVLKGLIEFQACEANSCLLPGEFEFEVEIVKVAGAVKTASATGQSPEGVTLEEPIAAAPRIILEAQSAAPENMAEPVVVAQAVELDAAPAPVVEEPVAVVDVQEPEEVVVPENEEVVVPQTQELASGESEPDGDKGNNSLWGTILLAIGGGLVAFVTPCVLPMAPMTVAFFLKNATSEEDEKKRVRRGRFQATVFGLFIVLIYTLPIAGIILATYFIGGENVTVTIFTWFASHWLPNTIFGMIFLIFGASFLGAFEINMPSWMISKSDSKSDKGGIVGIFFIALTLVLVSFSCTAPIVGMVLIEATTNGSFMEPIFTIIAFAVAFAIPFVLCALFPSFLKNMPKSGGWMNTIKVVLGLLEFAMALKFLSMADLDLNLSILDREVYLALWIAIGIILGVYLLGKLKFKHDDDVQYIGVGRLTLAIITFSFVMYMIPGMWGAPLKMISGLLPPEQSQDYMVRNVTSAAGAETEAGTVTVDGTTIDMSSGDTFINPLTGNKPMNKEFFPDGAPHNLVVFYDFDEALEFAKYVDKPLFVDVTGKMCVNCRMVENNIWSDPRVLNMLRNDFVIVALYLDVKDELPESSWKVDANGRTLKRIDKIATDKAKTYGTVIMPSYVITDTDGNELAKNLEGSSNTVDIYLEFLEGGLAKFKGQK